TTLRPPRRCAGPAGCRRPPAGPRLWAPALSARALSPELLSEGWHEQTFQPDRSVRQNLTQRQARARRSYAHREERLRGAGRHVVQDIFSGAHEASGVVLGREAQFGVHRDAAGIRELAGEMTAAHVLATDDAHDGRLQTDIVIRRGQ